MLMLQGVSFATKKGGRTKTILKDISLTAKDGELIVITGSNGSGKTTLAKLIAGIEKPSKGQIFIGKKDVTELDSTARARVGIAYSFQQPVRFKGLTVRDLLQVAVTGGETFLDKKAPKVDKYLKSVGLNPSEYLDREIDSSLSGGELKRIEIASVIARDAKVSVFDEPEAGIDIWSFDNLIRIFKSIQKKGAKRTIIIISHQERIMHLADRIIVLKGGKIIKQGPGRKVLAEMEKLK